MAFPEASRLVEVVFVAASLVVALAAAEAARFEQFADRFALDRTGADRVGRTAAVRLSDPVDPTETPVEMSGSAMVAAATAAFVAVVAGSVRLVVARAGACWDCAVAARLVFEPVMNSE